MISRLYADLLHLRDPAGPRIYDTDLSGNSVVTRFPDKTVLLNLAKVGDQLKLFDSVLAEPGRDHVVDLSDDMLIPFFSIYKEIDFEAGAAEAGVEITIHYIIDPSFPSVRTALDISKIAKNASFVPVRNLAIGDFLLVPGAEEIYEKIDFGSEITMPLLEPKLQAWIESPEFTWSGLLLGRHDDIPYETRVVITNFLESIYNQTDAREEEFR